MPFIGVVPERAALFTPAPHRAVAVSDAAAWRLYPAHRNVYNKLEVALAAGLRAAPCGVAPREYGIADETPVFVKPIINLFGAARGARRTRADRVPEAPGWFWCECLSGEHLSSDCLVREGESYWFAHSVAAVEKDAERPVYWHVGVARPEWEPRLADWVRRCLPGYTGLCNIEALGGCPIEIHLRGSNGFFDFYGPAFVPAWVALVDGTDEAPPPPVPGGYVLSVFGRAEPSAAAWALAAAQGVQVQRDRHTPGRVAILRCRDLAAGLRARAALQRDEHLAVPEERS